MPRVLHLLSQRPSLTGSGVTLDAMVRHAARAGWDQDVIVGVPASDVKPTVGGLASDAIHPLFFGSGVLNFPLPGMSDNMPYDSSRFSDLDAGRIERYVSAWQDHIRNVVTTTEPDVIHSHHIWLVSSVLKEIAPDLPVVTTCHATGLRQMVLCPHLTTRVRSGCARIDRFAALHADHADQLTASLGVSRTRIHVIGAGFRDDLFHGRGRTKWHPPRILYVGKLAAAKGVPSLLDAVEELAVDGVVFELHVAGSGSGKEADAIRRRMKSMKGIVEMHGQLEQARLAELMRQCTVCVLPSFYEGLPLVLAEAFACGCRLVATDLPGVREALAPHLGDALEMVPRPSMVGIDVPSERDVPVFKGRLKEALARAVAAEPLGDPAITHPGAVEGLTWRAVFRRVESIWRSLLDSDCEPESDRSVDERCSA